MISKTKISEIKKLSQKKYRDISGTFIVEGTKSTIDLLRSNLEIVEVWALEKWWTKYPEETKHIEKHIVEENELSRISCLTTPQEVLAIAKIPFFDIQTIDYQDSILVLDSIRDPGNMGTIIRTADWFGIQQIVCSYDCVEWTNPKTIQATMGSFSRQKLFYTHLPQFLSSAKIQGTIYGTFMQGQAIQNTTFKKNDVIIIGNEANGITTEVEHYIQQKITIPAVPHNHQGAESLNASIAAAITMYQWKKTIL